MSNLADLPASPDPGPETDPVGEALAAFRRLTIAAEQFHHAIAYHHGIGHTELLALITLGESGSLSARQLADRVSLSPSSITDVIDRLEAAGLAARMPHPTDRRRLRITLTDAGHRMVDAPRHWLREGLGGDGADGLPALTEGLTTLTDILTGQSDRLLSSPPERGHTYARHRERDPR